MILLSFLRGKREQSDPGAGGQKLPVEPAAPVIAELFEPGLLQGGCPIMDLPGKPTACRQPQSWLKAEEVCRGGYEHDHAWQFSRARQRPPPANPDRDEQASGPEAAGHTSRPVPECALRAPRRSCRWQASSRPHGPEALRAIQALTPSIWPFQTLHHLREASRLSMLKWRQPAV